MTASARTTWSAADVEELPVAPDAKEMLVSSGFPIQVDWTYSFPAKPGRIEGHPELVLLGHDGPTPLVVDASAAGRVFALEDLGPRYVNISAAAFIRCVDVYADYRESVRGLSETEAVRIIENVETRLREADASAVESEDTYWSVIVEQMRDGLL